MNLQERKAQIETVVARHRQEIGKLDAYREKLIAEINAYLGQGELLDELIRLEEAAVPPPELPDVELEKGPDPED